MSDRARQLAERELARALRYVRSELVIDADPRSGFIDDPFEWEAIDGARDSNHGNGVLLALERLGLLSREEAASWRRRLALATQAPTPVLARDSEQRILAERHLADLVDALPGVDGDETAVVAALARLNGALELLVRAGCLDPDAVAAWLERAGGALGSPAAPASDELHCTLEVRPSAGRLRDVVAVPLARHDDLCVLAVDLHERATVLHWHLLRTGPFGFAALERVQRSFALVDDVGTAYGEVMPDEAGWGERGPVQGAVAWQVAVPPQASELTITRGDTTWRAALQT